MRAGSNSAGASGFVRSDDRVRQDLAGVVEHGERRQPRYRKLRPVGSRHVEIAIRAAHVHVDDLVLVGGVARGAHSGIRERPCERPPRVVVRAPVDEDANLVDRRVLDGGGDLRARVGGLVINRPDRRGLADDGCRRARDRRWRRLPGQGQSQRQQQKGHRQHSTPIGGPGLQTRPVMPTPCPGGAVPAFRAGRRARRRRRTSAGPRGCTSSRRRARPSC